MFWNKKRKEVKRFPTLAETRAKVEDELADYEKILEEFTNKYLPLRDRLIGVIRSHNLNRYPLRDVLTVEYLDKDCFKFTVLDCIEDYWDGKQTLKSNGTLTYEEIQLDTTSLIRKWDKEHKWDNTPYTDTRLGVAFQAISKLEDPTKDFVYNMKKCKAIIEKLDERRG